MQKQHPTATWNPKRDRWETGGGGHLRALGRVLGDLAEIGYDAAWTTIRASDVGAPHHRARVFLIATPADTSGSGSITVHDRPGGSPACREGDGRADGSYRSEGTACPQCDDGGAGGRIGSGRETPVGAAATGGPEHGSGEGNENTSDTESVGRDHGETPHNRTPDREIHASRHDCHASADTHILGSQAGQQLTREHGEEVPITDGGGETLPNTSDDGCERGRTARDGRTGPADSHNRTSEWGVYAPAVRRWERIVGPAPAPTEPNRNNKPRLNAEFAEWMMGLPSGWITDVTGLSRADQLKAAGNGVVPQQAAAALRELLGMNDSTGVAA